MTIGRLHHCGEVIKSIHVEKTFILIKAFETILQDYLVLFNLYIQAIIRGDDICSSQQPETLFS